MKIEGIGAMTERTRKPVTPNRKALEENLSKYLDSYDKESDREKKAFLQGKIQAYEEFLKVSAKDFKLNTKKEGKNNEPEENHDQD